MGYTAAQDFGFVARIVGAAVWLRNRTSHTAQSERSRVAIGFFTVCYQHRLPRCSVSTRLSVRS